MEFRDEIKLLAHSQQALASETKALDALMLFFLEVVSGL